MIGVELYLLRPIKFQIQVLNYILPKNIEKRNINNLFKNS